MPWRECCKMDERLKFVAGLLDGDKMAVLCREFEISRKTGYKIFQRYKDCGIEGLRDRSRRPYRHARQLPFQIEKTIVQLKQEHPSWGAPKSANACAASTPRSTARPSAPCMRSWTVTAWLSVDAGQSTSPKAPPRLPAYPLTRPSTCATRRRSISLLLGPTRAYPCSSIPSTTAPSRSRAVAAS